jgi:toxin ParE1/3/4
MSRYALTTDAQNDFDAIADYLLEESGPRTAVYVAQALVSGFRLLARSPGIGHRREDLTPRKELRFWKVFSCLIVYRIDRRPLTIIGILHGNRDVQQLLSGR